MSLALLCTLLHMLHHAAPEKHCCYGTSSGFMKHSISQSVHFVISTLRENCHYRYSCIRSNHYQASVEVREVELTG
jgi:hypothetical protein